MASNNNILTGQFVRIEQTPAKMSLRFFAFIIDVVVMVAYVFFMSIVDTAFGIDMSTVSVILFIILPMLLYQPACEILTAGQTLGKYLLGTRVVTADGSSPSVGSFLLRWLLLPVDLLFFGAAAAFTMMVTSRRQRVGDIAAGTMVIRLNTYGKMRVNLDEFRFVEDGYQPTYEKARDITPEQAERIAHTLADRSTSRSHRIELLARELCSELRLPGDFGSYENLLTTLLSDYRYYDLNTL